MNITNIEPANESFSNKAIGIATMPSGLKLKVRTFNFVEGYPDEPICNVPVRRMRELSQGKRYWNHTIEAVEFDGQWRTSLPVEAYAIVETLPEHDAEIRQVSTCFAIRLVPEGISSLYPTIEQARAGVVRLIKQYRKSAIN